MADLEDVTLDGRPLNSLRVADLKAALEERGLSKSGAKNALVKRLKGALMLENLERTSTPNTGLQPNSQIGEEMSQNSFIKQYLAKQQELLRQRLEREAREAVETDDQTDHTSVNNRVSCPAPAQIGEEMSQNSFIKQYLAKQQELLRQRLEREAREAVGTDDHADHTRTNHSVSCSGTAQDATPAVSVAQHKQFGPSDGAGLSGSANEGELNRNQEANMSSPPASAAPTCAPGLVAMRLASGDRVPPSSQVQADSDDDEDWDSGLRRRSLGDPARRTTARKRSEASHQAPPHIPPLLSPQLCQPIPTTSPAPELSFPQPDTTKQSPPSPGMPPAWRQRASSTSSSGSSSSHSSSPEPQRSGQVQRKPGPLTLLARKLESEGAFSGAGWHSRDGNGEDSNIATVAPFPVRVSPEGVVSAITHTASMPFPMVPFHSQVPGSVHRANATEERVSRLEKEKALEKERLRALEVERQESQRILQEEQKREREEREALEQERIEQEKDLEREEKEMDLSDFDKGQIVMAIRLGQSISKTAGLVGCSRYAVVSTTKSGQRKKNNRRTGDRVFRKTRK